MAAAVATKVAALCKDSACSLSVFSLRSLNLSRLGDTKIPVLKSAVAQGSVEII